MSRDSDTPPAVRKLAYERLEELRSGFETVVAELREKQRLADTEVANLNLALQILQTKNEGKAALDEQAKAHAVEIKEAQKSTHDAVLAAYQLAVTSLQSQQAEYDKRTQDLERWMERQKGVGLIFTIVTPMVLAGVVSYVLKAIGL